MTEKDKKHQMEATSADDEGVQPSTVRLPAAIWEILDRDAKRCKRNRSQQLEALLEAFYFGVTANIPTDRLQEMAKVSSHPSPTKPDPAEPIINRRMIATPYIRESATKKGGRK